MCVCVVSVLFSSVDMKMLKFVLCKVIRTCSRQLIPVGGCIIVLLLVLVVSIYTMGSKPWYLRPSLVSEKSSPVLYQFEEVNGELMVFCWYVTTKGLSVL